MTAISGPADPERYFYHSFPRRGKGEEDQISKGLEILRLIRDFGLLLTPEVTSWEYPHADGTPPRKMKLLQRRACFTELSPTELCRHAREFGDFALEFEIDVLKGLGALPVFYIPKGDSPGQINSLGQTLVIQLIDAMCVIDRISRAKKYIETAPITLKDQTFRFGFDKQQDFSINLREMKKTLDGITHGATPSDMLSLALEGITNLFYFADADRSFEDSVLKYYRQREWRIAGNIGRIGKDLMGLPSPAMIDRLLALDLKFFGRDFPKQDDEITNPSLAGIAFGKRLVDWCFVYQGLDKRHILGAARRIIVPRHAANATREILSAHFKRSVPPPVVPIEDL
jgi:hypothetical protein